MSKAKIKVVNKNHVCEAMTQYLHSMSLLDKDMEVTSFKKSPEGLEVKAEYVD